MLSKIIEIIKLPKIKLTFVDDDPTLELKELYHHFTKRHPKYIIIRNKTIGVMLYKLPKNVEEYNKNITGKNSTGYFSRRCMKLGYYTKYFEQNEYTDEIYNINTSVKERQGRKMSEQYLKNVEKEEKKNCVSYFGVFTKDNLLVGYIRLIRTKNIYIISKLLGHKENLNDNIMYLLLHDLTIDLIKKGENLDYCQYFMYDTYFGGSQGIKLFKKRNCFTPYRVKWQYEKQN